MGFAQHVPDAIIDTGLSAYISAQRRVGRNVHLHEINGETIKYEYQDPRSFKLFRNLIDDGRLRNENISVDVLDRGPDCDAVIDVGAHYGLYSVILGKLNPGTQLYAYEPAPEPLDRLQRNLQLNGLCPDAKVSDNIVSGESGDAAVFYVDERKGSEQHSTTESEGKTQITRRTVALSDVFDVEGLSTPFIKIDAEGEEGQIVDDLVNQTAADSVCGLIELHPDKLKDYTAEGILETFRKNGFRVDFIGESTLDYKHDRPLYYFANELF